MKKQLFGVLLVVAAAAASACSEFREIPAGYAAKVLTPTGWQQQILTAGQVDLGEAAANGSYNVLVLLESSTKTIEEQFREDDPKDHQDHRVMTAARVPLAVDVYVQVGVPADPNNGDDKRMMESIFAQVTPKTTQDNRVREISLNDIYERFAQPTIRGKTRAIFAKYKNDEEVFKNYDKVNNEVAQMVVDTFTSGKVPLKLLLAQISNVKVDKAVWQAQAIRATADAQVYSINTVGAALRSNPQYQSIVKYDALKEIAKTGSASGVNTIIIESGATGNDRTAQSFTAAEYTAERVVKQVAKPVTQPPVEEIAKK